MGLTTMRLSTFYWVSQLGMLPATIVYVNAGKELAKIDSLGGILSPTLLLSFALLGIFPLAVKEGDAAGQGQAPTGGNRRELIWPASTTTSALSAAGLPA